MGRVDAAAQQIVVLARGLDLGDPVVVADMVEMGVGVDRG